MCDRHEIGLSEKHERGAMIGGELERSARVVNGAIVRKPEDACTEAA